MVPVSYSETSVINYHFSLRDNPEERSSQILCNFNTIYFISIDIMFLSLNRWCYVKPTCVRITEIRSAELET